MEWVYRSAIIPLLVRRWRAERGDPKELIDRFSLPPETEREGTVPVELERLSTCVDYLAAAFGDPHIGLHAASSVPRGYYGLIEFVCRTAKDLEAGIGALCRFERLINETYGFALSRDADVAVFDWRGGPIDRLSRQVSEYTLASIVGLGRKLIAVPWKFTSVWFATAAPASTAELEHFFGTRALRFGAESNGFSFDAALLAQPIVTGDPQLQAVLAPLAEKELEQRPSADDFVGQVSAAIRESIREGEVRLDGVAKRLHITGRTLQRRLADEKRSFQELVDQNRRLLATAYLEDPRLSISEIAFRLGYTSHGGFTRAFKDWTGQTPAEYRTAHGA